MLKWIVLAALLAVTLWLTWRQHSKGTLSADLDQVIEQGRGLARVAPPQAIEVARRALCLGVVLCRAHFETFLNEHTDAKERNDYIRANQAMMLDLNVWLQREGLWESVSALEKALLELPTGQWDHQTCIDASWRNEAFEVILWALQMRPSIPPYDQQVEFREIVRELQLLTPPQIFLQRSSLRPHAEIAQARDVSELWLWRARTTFLMNQPEQDPLPQGLTYEKVISMSADQAALDGLFAPIAGDFPALGKAYRDLTEDEWCALQSIATERLYGLNWLCGGAGDWDKVRTDT